MKVALRALPPREAIAFFRSKGLAPADRRFDFRDVWRNEHAQSFVVAKAMREEVLGLLRQGVDRALAEGQSLASFTAALEPELRRLGWWGEGTERDPLTGQLRQVRLGSRRRLEIIFDANMRAAHAAGKWARIQRVKDEFPFLWYRQIQRPTRRDEHVRYHNLIRRVDDPIWLRIYPPNGWRCGCTVRQVNQEQLDRRGLRATEDFELEERAVLNRRTGEIEPTALGVDPAWDGNPGAAFLALGRTHGATTAGVNAGFAARELGTAAELRLMGLGDGRERLAMLDLTSGDFLDAATGTADTVRLSQSMRQALRGERRLAAVHTHPASTPPSVQDLATLFAEPRLRSLAVVGHDGSVFRALKRRALELDLRTLDDTAGELLELVVGQGLVDARAAPALRPVVLARALHEAGVIRYQEGLSGAQADLRRPLEPVVEVLSARLARLIDAARDR